MDMLNERYELSNKETKRISELAKKADATYKIIGKTLSKESGVIGDAERFIPITYLATEDLLRHSETLGGLTKWLLGLTGILILLTVVLVVLTAVLISQA